MNTDGRRMKRWLEPAESDSPALEEVPPMPNLPGLEAAAEALARHGEVQHAVTVWAHILKLRQEASDAVT